MRTYATETDYLTIHKRGDDAYDVCDDRGRIAPIRQRPDGTWVIRDEPSEGATQHSLRGHGGFASPSAAMMAICADVLS